jgi:hypothetical protein
MKIISKFKDYYDFLQGIYGVDDKLILDRTNFYSKKYNPYCDSNIILHIGEWEINAFYHKQTDTYYYGESIKQFSSEFPRYSKQGTNKDTHYFIKDDRPSQPGFYILKEPRYLGDSSPTWEKDCPILLENIRWSENDFVKNPILKEYGVSTLVTPHQVWIYLSEWLGKFNTKKEPIVPVGDDKVRLSSAGFDLKTSFRNINKK